MTWSKAFSTCYMNQAGFFQTEKNRFFLRHNFSQTVLSFCEIIVCDKMSRVYCKLQQKVGDTQETVSPHPLLVFLLTMSGYFSTLSFEYKTHGFCFTFDPNRRVIFYTSYSCSCANYSLVIIILPFTLVWLHFPSKLEPNHFKWLDFPNWYLF